VQVTHALPLDDDAAHLGVPGPQPLSTESQIERPQRIERPVLPLMDVHDDGRRRHEILVSNGASR
jgi:hypothetical protein